MNEKLLETAAKLEMPVQIEAANGRTGTDGDIMHRTGLGVPFALVSILVGKIFGYSWQMSVAIGSSCLFGFPGTVIISNEVSESTGTTPEEKAFINAQIMPKMLVAGMVTVSITSVLIAGVMCKWL